MKTRADPPAGNLSERELLLYDAARETVARLSELAGQEWWRGWILWCDHRRQFPDEPGRRAPRWPWTVPRPIILPFRQNAADRRRRKRS